MMGLEIARRIGAPAAVLCPTTAIQAQWEAQAADVPLTALTYQAVCQTDDPEGALRAAAEARLAGRAGGGGHRRRHGLAPPRARDRAPDGRDQAARSRARAAPPTCCRRARGPWWSACATDGVRTVILDECHHLVSMWGYLVRDVLG